MDEVRISTRIAKKGSVFLPFSRGFDNGAGNPPVEGKHRTHNLWEQVWERDSLMDILACFVHLQVEEVDQFAKVFYRASPSSSDNTHLNAAFDPAVDRFVALDEEAARTFRGRLQSFCGLYSFLFDPALDDALIDRHGKHADFIDKIFSDPQMKDDFHALMLEAIYKKLTQ